MMLDFNDLVKKHDLKINGIIHIGAHYGQEHSLYESVNAKHVVYFEPHPDSFARLRKNLKKKQNTTLVNKALGSSEGVFDMHCSKDNAGMSNSMLKPADHATIYPGIVFDHVVKVPVSTLDKEIHILDKSIVECLNCIAIDVQGFEMEVFKGGEETLKKVDSIFTEINFRPMYESCALAEDLDSFLGKFNFYRTDTLDTGAGWGDALYVKIK